MERKRKGFTLVELLVVIAIIALLMGVLMPALAKVRAIAYRLTCGTNIAGFGKAMLMYASDYNEDFPRGGLKTSPWCQIGHIKDYAAADNVSAIGPSPFAATITSCYFLLVKYEEVGTKQFVCKGDAGCKPFKLSEGLLGGAPPPPGMKIEDCWDFGGYDAQGLGQPGKAVSYAYQLPFNVPNQCGAGTPGAAPTTSFALVSSDRPGRPVSADRNPWLDTNAKGIIDAPANKIPNPEVRIVNNQYVYFDEEKKGNSAAHQREGQNVMFLDAHVSFEKFPNVGIRNDNIYSCWSSCIEDEADKQGDFRFTCHPRVNGDTSNFPKFKDDSFLVSETNY